MLNDSWNSHVHPIRLDPVELGPEAELDGNVILGYPTGRPLDNRQLRIGSRARIRMGTVIYGGSTMGDDLQTGHGVVIREENVIGNGLMIWSNSVIDYGCTVGDAVRIHCNVYLAQFTQIGDEAFIAPGVTTTNDPHPICTECMKGPIIGKRARIGANSTILPHVHVGDDALIGAGAVVTKDVPPRAVVTGNPARIVGEIQDLQCRWGSKDAAYPHIMSSKVD